MEKEGLQQPSEEQEANLLEQLSQIPKTSLEYEYDRSIAIVNLMDHYADSVGNEDKYVRYMHLLFEQHVAGENYIEAGLTLALYANRLKWSDEILEPLHEVSQSLKQETMSQRKENLISLAVEYFEKGNDWESALAYLNLIKHRHVEQSKEITSILQHQSDLSEIILNSPERLAPQYFRVSFYGTGFSTYYSNKEFIYRTKELVRIDDFTSQMKLRFPNAEILKSSTVPIELFKSNGQHLLITNANPATHGDMLPLRTDIVSQGNSNNNANLPEDDKEVIGEYQKRNSASVFVYTKVKASRAGQAARAVDKRDTCTNLWIINKFFITEHPFPSIKRVMNVSQVIESEVNPIDGAIQTIRRKMDEIIEAMKKLKVRIPRGHGDITPFICTINGVVDAAVGGGFNSYTEAFLTPQFQVDQPLMAEKAPILRAELLRQLYVLAEALDLIDQHISPVMRPLYDHMCTNFQKVKARLFDFIQNN